MATRTIFGGMSFSESQVTGHANGKPAADPSPVRVVRQFLEGLAAGDLDGAADLLALDVEYINVSTPTIRGRNRSPGAPGGDGITGSGVRGLLSLDIQ